MRQIRRPEVSLARKLRRVMTLPEVMLWQQLRGSPGGLRFRRQHPIGCYVADFYCSKARLIVEVDGAIHGVEKRLVRDAGRDRYLNDNGYRVMRIGAADILRDAEAVAASILSLAAAPLHHSPAASGPPPRSGEE
ncbi:endonuclease domain-containing protein [Sphingomonas sp. CFBP8993]|nr:endonuclease domain-containing protein [Sphingomonas sp. CFBP8993]MDY0959549.1 endonuclease domain-containing protein [Sphingomonas sp. CFBP8993]